VLQYSGSINCHRFDSVHPSIAVLRHSFPKTAAWQINTKAKPEYFTQLPLAQQTLAGSFKNINLCSFAFHHYSAAVLRD